MRIEEPGDVGGFALFAVVLVVIVRDDGTGSHSGEGEARGVTTSAARRASSVSGRWGKMNERDAADLTPYYSARRMRTSW